MENLVLVKISQSKAHFNEELPNFFLLQWTIHLLLQVLANVSILTVFHDDVYRVSENKGIIVLDYVLGFDF